MTIQSESRHVLTEEHDLFYAVPHQFPCFLHNAFRIAAPFVPAHVRNDAVTAVPVATAHDGDEGVVLDPARTSLDTTGGQDYVFKNQKLNAYPYRYFLATDFIGD